jgi:hypothetical protein
MTALIVIRPWRSSVVRGLAGEHHARPSTCFGQRAYLATPPLDNTTRQDNLSRCWLTTVPASIRSPMKT